MITRDVKDPWRAWKVTGMEEKGGREGAVVTRQDEPESWYPRGVVHGGLTAPKEWIWYSTVAYVSYATFTLVSFYNLG